MNIIYTETSSSGNCSVIQNNNHNTIIIDVGIKYDSVNRQVGYILHKADACLITHYHNDHIGYIKDFLKAGIICFVPTGYENNIIQFPYKRYLKLDESLKLYDLTGFLFKPIEMVHTNSDGTNCTCVGYLIADKSTGEKLLWATDTQYIKNRFPPLYYYCIECNYFEKDSWQDEKIDFEKVIEERRMKSHMSFESCVKFLKMQDLSLCKGIYLLHLSSSIDIPKEEIKNRLAKEIGREDVPIYV